MLAWIKSLFRKPGPQGVVLLVDREGVIYPPVRRVVLRGSKHG